MSTELSASKTIPKVQFDGRRDGGKGAATRLRILEIAQASVLTKGFGATSIEEVISEAGITKGGFFYHFKDKNELAHAMLRRYVNENDQIFDDIFRRGQELADDPLDAFLIGLKLLAELMTDLPSLHPGCLISAICYQERLFDRQVREMSADALEGWNRRFLAYLQEIAAIHPPREGIDLRDLAHMLSCVIDGAIIMAKALHDVRELERQVLAYRSFVRLVFSRP